MPKRNYQQIKSELDEVMDFLQNPETDIDDALTHYEKAKKLIAELEQYLEGIDKTLQNS